MVQETYLIERENAVLQLDGEPTTIQPHIHRILTDSGDSIHLTPIKEFIRNIRPLEQPITIRGAFGKETQCTLNGEGEIPIGNHVLKVDQLVYCPQLRDTLLSMVKLMRAGHRFDLEKYYGRFHEKTGAFTVPVSYRNNVMALEGGTEVQNNSHTANALTRSAAKQANTPLNTHDEQKEIPPAIHSVPSSESEEKQPSTVSRIPASSKTAHARYGHLCGRKLDQLVDFGAVEGLLITHKHSSHKGLNRACDACMTAKMSRLKFGKEIDHQAHAPNDLIAADVCGPIATKTQADGSETKYYFSLITDIYSSNVSLRIMTSKSEASDHCISYFHRSKILTGRDLRHFHTDGGKEYNACERTFENRGVKVTRTPIHTPQHNGIAERKNRTIMDMALALCQHAGKDPRQYFIWALEGAAYLHNRITVHSKHGKTFHQLFTGRKPDVSGFRVLFCDAFVRVADPRQQGKFVPKAQKGVFIGYDMKREGCYRVLVGNKIEVSRDVVFQEDQFTVDTNTNAQTNNPTQQKKAVDTSLFQHVHTFLQPPHRSARANSSSSSSESDSDSMSDVEENEQVDRRTMNKIVAAEKRELKKAATTTSTNPTNNQQPPPQRRSTQESKPTRQSGLNPDDFGRLCMAMYQELDESESAEPPVHSIRTSEVTIPNTWKQALASPYAHYFRAAMKVEMMSILAHETFELVPVPDGVNVVSCRWVFAVKSKDGWVTRFKARLVARGFSNNRVWTMKKLTHLC